MKVYFSLNSKYIKFFRLIMGMQVVPVSLCFIMLVLMSLSFFLTHGALESMRGAECHVSSQSLRKKCYFSKVTDKQACKVEV